MKESNGVDGEEVGLSRIERSITYSRLLGAEDWQAEPGGLGRIREHRTVRSHGQEGEGGWEHQPEPPHPGQSHHVSGGQGPSRAL